jgi:CheY-like chemotaxis protein
MATSVVTSERSPVLIVDDRPANRIALRGILEPLEFPVVEAASGEEALRHLLDRDVALVLLDVDMPDMDGFQTAEFMRRHPRTRQIPIIFLTAFDDLLDRAHEGYAFGAVDYIAKPFDPEMLRSKVRFFLELHQKTALLERQTRQLETSIEQLRLSRSALADAQRIANLGNFEYDPRTGRVRGSRQLHDIFGEPPDAPLPPATDLFERLHLRPDGQSGELLIRSATRANFDGQLTRRDGTTREVVVHVEPRSDTLTIVGTIQDITEHRDAQRALDETTRALERERELVHVFHQTVVAPLIEPSSLFDVSYCYRPADAAVVGGDWYDVLPLADGHVLMVIGDVGGHGLSAASVMSEIRTALREASISEVHPRRLIERVDRYMATFRSATFATMLLVRFDQDSGECVIASAGHLPAVEFGAGGEPEVRWAPSGPPLGAAMIERKESMFVLGPGRSLALYTDGLVERRGELIDDGISRLRACVATLDGEESSLAEAAVHQMCRDTGLTDDVAMLVVSRGNERRDAARRPSGGPVRDRTLAGRTSSLARRNVRRPDVRRRHRAHRGGTRDERMHPRVPARPRRHVLRRWKDR